MGVPKFYRWTSERYPCLSEVINESQIPEFDNLYLDMNGIIHNCSHPNDDDVSFRITEEEIFTNIFAYIENLYNMIRPQKIFFMAVDGVAPRAKMNQQRARRFMSARTAEAQMRKAKEKGEVLPDEKRFDSNCITPGTFFMTRLHERLVDWIQKKSSADPRWHGRRIILSGHNCPGEGEHKIMDFIRSERATNGYDPNTRHCMYGLDADLIMLGIVSHEPHFSLLREEVTFNTRPRRNDQKNKKPQRTDCVEKTFHLLHLSLLREYLAWEFSSVKENLAFAYDMERVADDWILMGLLVGNDFLPHLPNIHIHDDALPLLYSTYKTVLPTLDGYINESGYLNLGRFEKFLKQLSLNDKDSFMEKLEDEQFLDSKKIRTTKKGEKANESCTVLDEDLVAFESSDIEDDAYIQDENEVGSEEEQMDAAFVSDDENEGDDYAMGTTEEDNESPLYDEFLEQEFNDELATLSLSAMDDKDFANNVEACWTRTLNNSFKRHKKAYYTDKLRYKNISKTELREQAEGYVRAIQWNLHYYYHGCASWSWFYPHHYAPFISDVTGFADMKIEFELSEPFRPFEQLLAVLPEASSDCLPKPLQKLMTANPSDSPIHDFYPMNFETDLNGKRNDWEAVVLIPFIDEKRLLEAIRMQENQLTKDEKARNSHGGHVQCISSRGTRPGEEGQWIVTKKVLRSDTFLVPREHVKWGLLPNVKMDVYFPGFPTMKHLSHTGSLRYANCNIFGMASRKESMVLTVEAPSLDKDIIEWGSVLCDEEVCIDWPILKLAKVDSIWGDYKIVRKTESDDDIIVKDMKEEEKKQWVAHVNQLTEQMLTRYAIEIGGLFNEKGKHVRPAIVWVRKFTGLVYETIPAANGKPPMLKAVKQWSNPQNLVPVLLPLVVKDVLLENSRLLADLPIKQAYPEQSVVWVTDPKLALFGMPGMVSGYKNERDESCRVKVVGMVGPNKVDKLEILRRKYDQKTLRWMGGHDCARTVQIDTRLFARITGTILLWNEPRDLVEKGQQLSSDSKINCGLALKFSKRDICVADYTDRIEFTNSRGITNKAWYYSNLACRLVQEYRKKFPEVIRYLENTTTTVIDDIYYAEDIWTDEKKREGRFSELKEFLNNLSSKDAEQLKCGTVYADCSIIAAIEKAVEEPIKEKRMMNNFWVPPSHLFRYELYDGKVHIDPEADYQLLDRVAMMSSHTRVPKTVQGTIVGLHGDKIDVLFDREFEGGSKVRGSSLAAAYRVPKSALFNVTYGLIRKCADKKQQHQKNFDGAYVPLPPKVSKKSSPESSTSSASPFTPVPVHSTNQQTKPKKGKKEKCEKIFVAKRPGTSDSAEDLTNSLHELLNIKSERTPASEGISTTSTHSAPKEGKQVSLMELLGGASGKNTEKSVENVHVHKRLEGSQTLEEIEKIKKEQKPKKMEVSILEQLSEAQKPKLPKEEKLNRKGYNQKDCKEQLEHKQQKKEVSTAPTGSLDSVPLQNDRSASNDLPPFNRPPPEFIPPFALNMPIRHAMFGAMRMPVGPIGMPVSVSEHPSHQHHKQNQRKRANPTLTDFKPSTVNRRPNHHRGNPNAPKVMLITHTKEKKEQKEQYESNLSVTDLHKTAIPSNSTVSQDPSSSSGSKKPRKKKQSRLAVHFQNSPDAQ